MTYTKTSSKPNSHKLSKTHPKRTKLAYTKVNVKRTKLAYTKVNVKKTWFGILLMKFQNHVFYINFAYTERNTHPNRSKNTQTEVNSLTPSKNWKHHIFSKSSQKY